MFTLVKLSNFTKWQFFTLKMNFCSLRILDFKLKKNTESAKSEHNSVCCLSLTQQSKSEWVSLNLLKNPTIDASNAFLFYKICDSTLSLKSLFHCDLCFCSHAKVHSFLKQCLLDRWYFHRTFQPNHSWHQLKGLVKVPLFCVKQRSCKHCFKTNWL